MTQLLCQRLIAPSILSADFARLGESIAAVMDAGARLIHVDVMDGRFVPNITIGLPVVEALSGLVHDREGRLDVHLMIDEPERYIERFAAAGADVVTVHQEACRHLNRTLSQIREAGAAAGIAINPATPVSSLTEARAWCDLVLVMSVNPGFGGQRFIPESMAKLRAARELLPPSVAVEVDGGVDAANAAELVRAGANLLVAGSSVFAADDPATSFQALSAAVGGAL
jgi:ribulose-phosphate 3-epimerase